MYSAIFIPGRQLLAHFIIAEGIFIFETRCWSTFEEKNAMMSNYFGTWKIFSGRILPLHE